MAHIVARIQGGFEHARIHRYLPLRIWLTPADYCQLCDNLPHRSHAKRITFNDIPITLGLIVALLSTQPRTHIHNYKPL